MESPSLAPAGSESHLSTLDELILRNMVVVSKHSSIEVASSRNVLRYVVCRNKQIIPPSNLSYHSHANLLSVCSWCNSCQTLITLVRYTPCGNTCPCCWLRCHEHRLLDAQGSGTWPANWIKVDDLYIKFQPLDNLQHLSMDCCHYDNSLKPQIRSGIIQLGRRQYTICTT